MTTTVEDVAIDEEPPTKRVKTEDATPAMRMCQFCAIKKQVATNCVSLACKKCCLARSQVCATHPKEEEKPTRLKKRVLKNEFRETNFHYYGETVTIFCARDFFEMKKISQGVLKDQERTQRVSGNAWGRRKKKYAATSKIKELIQCALGKRPAPAGYGDVKVPVQMYKEDQPSH